MISASIAMTVGGSVVVLCNNLACLETYSVDPDAQSWQAEAYPGTFIYNNVPKGGVKTCTARSVSHSTCPFCQNPNVELEDDVSTHVLRYPNSNTHYEWTSTALPRNNNVTYTWEVNTSEGN